MLFVEYKQLFVLNMTKGKLVIIIIIIIVCVNRVNNNKKKIEGKNE